MLELFVFSLGAAHTVFYHRIPDVATVAALTLAAILVAARNPGNAGVRSVGFFLLGTTFGSYAVGQRVDMQLPEKFEQVPQRIEFIIDSIPVEKPPSTRFLARVLAAGCQSDDCPKLAGQRIRLSWYYPRQPLHAGQVWTADVKLKAPRGSVNPGGFDYQAWLLSQRVTAVGYASGRLENSGFKRNLAWWRQTLRDALLGPDKTLHYQRFLAALLVGDKSAITAEDWRILQATGTVHLMAISGLHIGLVAVWGLLLGAALGRFGGIYRPLTQAQTVARCKCMFSISLASLYAALAGFSIPTLRALAACVIVCLAQLVDLRLPARALLVGCLFVVACVEPLAWVSSGFYLSFLAVALLLFTFSGRQYGRYFGLFRAQGVLTVGLLLPLLVLGQPGSFISPLANLVVVPVVSFLVIPGLLLAVFCQLFSEALAQLVLQRVDQVFAWVWGFLSHLGSLPSILWWPGVEMPAWVLVICGLCALLVLLPSALQVRALAVVVLAACLLGYQPRRPDFRMAVLDVGQGLSVVLETPERTWVYDTGARFSDDFDAGQQMVLPYLRRVGVRRVSVVVSHNDLDHSGGLASIAEALPIEQLLVGEAVALRQPVAQPCRAGDSWDEGQLRFRVLWPPKNVTYSGNNSSCVLLLEWSGPEQNVRILLTGDIDKKVEYQLLSQLHQPIDVLVAPHHGSKTSSGPLFIKRLKPAVVVFSSGYKNRYNHPHPDVTARYRRAGTTMLNTATDGAVMFQWETGRAPTIKRARAELGRPWILSAP